MSMVLSGHIEVTPEGAVSSLVLDQKAMVAPGIASFVEGTIGAGASSPRCALARRWPRGPLRVRLRGKAAADGGYEISMTSVDFSEYDPEATDSVTPLHMTPPRYRRRPTETVAG